MTFIDEMIRRVESQASVGPQKVSRKGFTLVPQAAESPTTTYGEIHRKTKGSEKSFQNTTNLHLVLYKSESCVI